jgi:hypothetical protein
MKKEHGNAPVFVQLRIKNLPDMVRAMIDCRAKLSYSGIEHNTCFKVKSFRQWV